MKLSPYHTVYPHPFFLSNDNKAIYFLRERLILHAMMVPTYSQKLIRVDGYRRQDHGLRGIHTLSTYDFSQLPGLQTVRAEFNLSTDEVEPE